MNEVLNEVWIHFKEYLVLYLLGLVIFGLILINRKIKKKRLAEKKQEIAKQVVEKVPKPEKTIAELFEGEKETEEKTLQEQLKVMYLRMKKDDLELDKHMFGDLKELKKYHAKITESRENIREYGLKLAKLFEKYSAREHQLNAMIIGMEDLTKELKQENNMLEKKE
jgi:hypothetical protein